MPDMPRTKFNSPWTVENIEAELNGTKNARGNITMTEKLAQKVETSTYTTDKAALDAEIATKSTVDDICGKGNRIYGTYASLNDIMTPGRYYVATGAQAVTITNSPYTAAGYGLYVIANSSDDRPAQILLPNPVQGDTDTYGLFFKRDYIYNAWGPWFKFEGTEVSTQSAPASLIQAGRIDAELTDAETLTNDEEHETERREEER